MYYLGLRRGEALGLQWGDFDFDEDLVHIQRDIDFCGSTARDGDLKTDVADRYVPIPGELRAMLTKMRGFPQQYLSITSVTIKVGFGINNKLMLTHRTKCHMFFAHWIPSIHDG